MMKQRTRLTAAELDQLKRHALEAEPGVCAVEASKLLELVAGYREGFHAEHVSNANDAWDALEREKKVRGQLHHSEDGRHCLLWFWSAREHIGRGDSYAEAAIDLCSKLASFEIVEASPGMPAAEQTELLEAPERADKGEH